MNRLVLALLLHSCLAFRLGHVARMPRINKFLPSMLTAPFRTYVKEAREEGPRADTSSGNHHQTHTDEIPNSSENLCARPEAKFLDGKCLEMKKTPQTFNDALEHCLSEKGKLYEPNFENPFLFQYFLKFFPEIFDGQDEKVMIGYSTDSSLRIRNPDRTNDVTGNPFFTYIRAKNFPKANKCVFLSLSKGGIDPSSVGCNVYSKFSFVCEYPSLNPMFKQDFW